MTDFDIVDQELEQAPGDIKALPAYAEINQMGIGIEKIGALSPPPNPEMLKKKGWPKGKRRGVKLPQDSTIPSLIHEDLAKAIGRSLKAMQEEMEDRLFSDLEEKIQRTVKETLKDMLT